MAGRSLANEINPPYHRRIEKGPAQGMEDETALVNAARHDPVAFSLLYRRYVTRVYRYLYSHVPEGADAEDLTAQVFMAVWEGLSRYREQGNFAAWLFSIARNKANDYYRRRRPHLSLDEARAQLQQDWDPLEGLELGESLHSLSSLVSDLDPEQQELLRLRFAADLTYAQIAAILHKREAAVKMAINRLLRQLRAGFDENAGGPMKGVWEK